MDPKVVFGIVRNLAYYEMKYFERPQIRYVNNDMKYLFVKICHSHITTFHLWIALPIN